MSKKPHRRKKARRSKARRTTFRIVLEAQPIVVHYRPDRMCNMAHFEYRSPYRPPRRIPVSETGYRSHYVSMSEVKAAKSPKDFAHSEALDMLRSRRPKWDDANELPLF